jgi:hypothetical protein
MRGKPKDGCGKGEYPKAKRLEVASTLQCPTATNHLPLATSSGVNERLGLSFTSGKVPPSQVISAVAH